MTRSRGRRTAGGSRLPVRWAAGASRVCMGGGPRLSGREGVTDAPGEPITDGELGGEEAGRTCLGGRELFERHKNSQLVTSERSETQWW